MAAARWASLALLCLLGALQPRQAAAKLQRSVLRLGTGPRQAVRWQYVGKFGYAIGEGSYELRIRELVPGSLPPGARFDLEVFMDEDWDGVEAVAEVCRKKEQARRTRDVAIGQRPGSWGPRARGAVRQIVRPHVWYFALSDCSGAALNGTQALELEIEYLQEGGSHFSMELQWAPGANALALLGCSGFLYSFCRRSREFWDRTGAMHPVIWTLAAVLLLQFAAQCLHTGHLAIYRSNGEGSHLADVLSEVLFTLCQVIQTCVLVMIAMGYTLFQAGEAELDVALPVCGFTGSVHVALAVLGKVQVEAAHRAGGRDGFVGWALLALRLVLYLWFLWAANRTARKGGMRLKAFISHFRIAASLYFLAYPGAFLAGQLVAPYLREPLVEGVLSSAQVASNVWLASLFLDRGAYFHASSLSASPLPSRVEPCFFKQE